MSDIQVRRNEVFDWRKKEWVDEILPTLTVKQAGIIRGTGATVTAGSHRIGQGSTLLITAFNIASGSPDFWWALTHEGTPFPGEKRGTIDCGYFGAKGETRVLGNVKEPIKVVGPGSMRLQFLTPGSAKDFSFSFEGVER
jgi:hypothetical protein